MHKLTPFMLPSRHLLRAIVLLMAVAFFIGNASAASAESNHHSTSHTSKVTVWIQVTDSCKQALSGATFTVKGPGIDSTTAPTTGTIPRGLPGYINGQCPIQQGVCINFTTGCTSIILPVPISGTVIYKITVARTAHKYGTNLRYAICDGGSACPHGPEVATMRIRSTGSVSATVLNHDPDGKLVKWPANKQMYSGSHSDPILFHEYGIGNGSIQCDGNHDADDYLTGSPGADCDSDKP